MGLTCSLFRFLAHPKTIATMKVPLECCCYICVSLFDSSQCRYMAAPVVGTGRCTAAARPPWASRPYPLAFGKACEILFDPHKAEASCFACLTRSFPPPPSVSYIVRASSLLLLSFAPAVHYKGPYPLSPLTSASAGPCI
jgi:hypothetical protein